MKWMYINAVAIISTGFAGTMAVLGISGWGWFLLVGICSAVYPKSVNDGDEKTKTPE